MLRTKKEMIDWLDKYHIKKYTIHQDLTVDINSDVHLEEKKLTDIPLKFGTIKGNFYCYNNKLTNLDFAPQTVHGDFSFFNNEITSLKGIPLKIDGKLYFW